MKELSMEEKAKRYDEAIKKAESKIKNNKDHVLYEDDIIEIFPELKEDEDEKIRKYILKCCEETIEANDRGLELSMDTTKKLKNWLERQDEPINEEKVLIGARKDVAMSIMDFLFENTLGGMCIYNECKDLEDAVVNSDWLKAYNYMKKKLEKQGEQKPAKNIVETWKDMRLEVYQQASGNRHEPNYSDDTTKMFSLNDIDEIIEKMSEQNHANKIEHKDYHAIDPNFGKPIDKFEPKFKKN